jgi:hypothetical protein
MKIASTSLATPFILIANNFALESDDFIFTFLKKDGDSFVPLAKNEPPHLSKQNDVIRVQVNNSDLLDDTSIIVNDLPLNVNMSEVVRIADY